MKTHGMELTLNKNNNITANETPTPTRFIRNCEAIGLFQDLNPFDETFKKAVENVKRGNQKQHSVSYLEKSAGDELHTPQVFPDGSELSVLGLESAGHTHHIEEVVVRSEADTSIAADGDLLTSQAGLVCNENVSEDSVHVLFEMPNGTVLQLSAKPVKNDAPQNGEAIRIAPIRNASNNEVILTTPDGNPVMVPPKQPPTNVFVKEKLKAFLGGPNKSRKDNSVPIHRANVPQKRASSINLPKERIVPLISEPPIETEDDKKKLVLERNRKAAYRCRLKRKRHMEDLESANKMLTQEVTALRSEVMKLQTLLMTNANCPNCSLPTLTVRVNQTLETARSSVTSTIEACETIPVTMHQIQTVQQRKDSLTLDIARATENSIMDLDSPSIVRCDEVLSSVAPPSTPDERIDPFIDLENDMGEPLEKHLHTATTVIQLNPNVLKGTTSI